MERGRKQWGQGGYAKAHIVSEDEKVKAVKEEVPAGYEEYLLLLQQRNRLVKKLKKKNNKEIELERKEQGFSLYVNGANTGARSRMGGKAITPSPRTVKPTPKPKTAGDIAKKRNLDIHDLAELERLEQEQSEKEKRAQTAPSKVHRKNWLAGSVQIKTSGGDKMKIKAPELLTGNYEDDFEEEELSNESSDGIDSEDEHEELTRHMSRFVDSHSGEDSSDLEIDASKFDQGMGNSEDKTAAKKEEEEEDEDEISEHLMLSMDDVKKLRQSMELHASIQQSIAEEISSGEEETGGQSPIPEKVTEKRIAEVEEDMVADSFERRRREETKHVAQSQQPVEKVKRQKPLEENPWAPGDMIVLEFGPSIGKRKERDLSSGKRRSLAEDPPPRKPKKEDSKPASKDVILAPDQPLRKPSRPLSASKKSKSTSSQLDSTVDRSAVLQAIQAENAEVEKYARDTKSAPSRQSQQVSLPTNSKSENVRPISVTSKLPENKVPDAAENIPVDVSPPQLSEEKLTKVLKKVLQMEGKQQKKLLKALSKIEDTASAENSPRLSSEAMSKPNSQDVTGVGEQAISHSFDKKRGGSMKRQVAIDRVSPNPVQSEDIVELHLVLLSNWGHPSRIGLTEIQAFDSEGNRIDLTCGDAQVYGAKDCKGDLDNLFNGRFKTTKERNMWSCSFVPEKPVEITLNVKRGKDSSKEFGISKLRIWNYNKSLNELSVGVKAMQVFLGAELIFSGDIDKGCGNQVFDYSKTIVLGEDDTSESNQKGSDSAAVGSQLAQGRVERSMDVNRSVTVTLSDHSPTRPETRTLDHSTGNLQLPVVDDTTASTHVRASIKASVSKETNQSTNPDPKVITAKSPKVSKRMAANFDPQSKDQPSPSPRKSDSNPKLSQSKSKQKNPKGIEKTPKADEKTITPEKKTSKASEKTPKSKEPVLDTDVQDSVSDSMDGVSMLQQIQEITNSRAGSRSPSRPQWLESSVEASRPHSGPSKPKEVPKWLKAEEITDPFIAPPESRAGSRSSAQPQTIDDALPMWPSAGVEALPTVLDPDTDGKRDRRKHTPDHVADENEELRWRQRQVSIDSDDEPPMKKIEQKRENHRNKMKHLKEFSLEESWTSLDLFSKSHKGRISVDFEGDALDEYLQLEKKQPFEPTIQEETGIEEDFMIPELPFGKELVINIKSTWGDKHYVGLNGIEIFSSKGVPVPVAKISANPPDINVLNDYGKDPRVAANLVDGINRTRDDIHMWLAPFTKGGNHFIYITFEEPCKVAMVRIWNYNKSRIHSYRGAKDVEMMLDGSFIFKGEIARACGGVMGGTEAFGDTILFTVDEEILEAVSLNDEAYEAEAFSEDEMEDDVPFERPKTADEENQDRPFTCAVGTRGRGKIETQDVSTVQPQDDHSHISYEGELVVYTGQCLQLNFTSTWGDHHYLGLTGLEVVGKDGEALPITMNMIDANPRDLHVLPGYETDDRTLDKLIDGTNITMSDEHMWLVPYTEGEDHLVTVDFGQPTAMVALRIWNYNKSAEDTYRGAQILHCTLDGKVISPPSGHLVRKGPGNCFFDFMQEIPFSRQPEEVTFPMLDGKMRQSKVVTEEPSQEYEAVQMPCGFIYQLHFLSTWGDPYYVGLNGLEFYDAAGNKIDLVENNIAAYPDSVNVLDGVSNDVRTPDKLIDGVNDTTDGRHMWLAPILPSLMNRIFVIFDEPRTISMIKLWNYSKTPTRGVKDFALLVDDLLVYNGQIGPVQSVARGILPTCDLPQPYHTILFTDDKHIAQRERHTVIKKQAADQDIQLTNDMTVVSHFNNPKEATSQKTVNQALRPTTSVSNRNKKK